MFLLIDHRCGKDHYQYYCALELSHKKVKFVRIGLSLSEFRRGGDPYYLFSVHFVVVHENCPFCINVDFEMCILCKHIL